LRSNTDNVSPVPGVANEATEQLYVNGVGEPTVVLAAVGLSGIPPTHTGYMYTVITRTQATL